MDILFKIVIGIVVVLVSSIGYMIWASGAENPAPVTALNPQSSMPKAIVIYDPGISDFHEKVAKAYADGLTEKWHVETTTASKQTPTEFKDYNLIVIGGPIYGDMPSKPIQDYLSRVGNLRGMKVVSLITGAGAGNKAESWMKERISSLGGDVAGSILLYTMAPNTDRYGMSDALEIASKEARSLGY